MKQVFVKLTCQDSKIDKVIERVNAKVISSNSLSVMIYGLYLRLRGFRKVKEEK